jgi:assimilatory nitrate reductase catalytic subunit
MLARIRTPRGEAVAIAKVSDRQRRGSLFMPMHWTAAYAPQGRSNALIGPHRDAASGQPEFKHSPARLTAWRDTWRGFLMSRAAAEPPPGASLVWRRTVRTACHVHEFAGRGDEAERGVIAKAFSAAVAGEILSLDDPAIGAFRRAWIAGGKLKRVLFVTQGTLPPRDWLAGLFEAGELSASDRIALLSGRPLGAAPDIGPVVCACVKVGAKAIQRAVANGAATVEAVGAVTGAGTNCGSCRIEIARLLSSKDLAHAA